MADLSKLAGEAEFLDQNRDEFLERFPGKFLLIKGRKLQGQFNTREEAIQAGVRKYGLGSFLVRQAGEDAPVFSIPALALGILQGPNAHL